MPVECPFEELVPERRPTVRQRIATARRGQTPSDRCCHPASPHQSRMYRVNDPNLREVFDGDPGSIALSAANPSPPRIASAGARPLLIVAGGSPTRLVGKVGATYEARRR
jgi:hypothetical protein